MNIFTANRKLLAVAFAALVTGLALGRLLDREPSSEHPPAAADQAETAQAWTCSMHPQIRMPKPGQCPLCGMDLIPLVAAADGDALGPRQLRLSATARRLASIQVEPVQRRFVEVETRLVGRIAVDETRRRHIAARVPGRIDRLYVDYTGISVRQGDHMVELYSPELLTAQQELIQALRTTAQIGGSAAQTLKAARDKLRLLGLQPDQIAAIETRHQPADHLIIYAPAGGVVVEKHLDEGAYVQTGTRIYTIADLSQVWLQLDAYEQDLVWVRYGQQVEFAVESYPGETFTGRIAFISPTLDERTRTIKVRVNVANEKGRLKPGMFARAVVRSQAAAGRVMDPDLAGKWISPMHPEIVKDGPGACDVCGMPLVPAESLGYASAVATEAPLIIPASAPLLTGKRAVVYVAVPGREGVFEGRQIELGPRATDYYIVTSGLHEGEQVVVEGSFKIDSALQIIAKKSMMNPAGGAPAPGHQHGSGTTPANAPAAAPRAQPISAPDEHAGHARDDETAAPFAVPPVFQEQLADLFAAYFEIQQGLSLDAPARATDGATALARALEQTDMSQLEGTAHTAWMQALADLRAGSEKIRQAADIESARATFEPLSDTMTRVADQFGTGRPAPVYRFHCPMAFGNRGASWLQEADKTENPYFGSRMYRCGSRQGEFTAAPGSDTP